jgi:hypothetical protein
MIILTDDQAAKLVDAFEEMAYSSETATAFRKKVEALAILDGAQRMAVVWHHKDLGNRAHMFYDSTETQPEGCTPLYAVKEMK